MKRKSIVALTFVLALAAGAFLLPAVGPQVQAQQPCKAFRAIWQGFLPPPYQLVSTDDSWAGPVYASLGGEILLGAMSGNDGVTTGHGTIGMGRGGKSKLCFSPLAYNNGTHLWDCTDSFRFGYSNAVFPFPPSKVGFGDYKAIDTIVQGTGRFQLASGQLDESGPFIVGQDSNGNWFGRANIELNGHVCGVQ
jgi:hypothetical protein